MLGGNLCAPPDSLYPSRMMTDEIERAAGRVVCAGFEGRELPEGLARRLSSDALAGVILFRRNLGALEDVAALTRAIHRCAPARSPIVSLDQEGGRVARLDAPIVKLPPMRRFGEHGDARLTERAGEVLGAQLAAVGFNVDFAPVLDVDTNPDNPVIGDRSFGRDPSTVIEHALAFARGLEGAGVAACGKHFPGHGDTDLDSHLALPRVSHARERLDRIELAPFRAARGALSAIMTAHVVFDALDPEIPATLSRRVLTGLLRGELGYEGIIISDDLEMKAVFDRWGVEESAVRAIDAGADLLLICRHEALVERAIAALAARAREDAAFLDRLRDADRRLDAFRARLTVPDVEPALVRGAIESDAARAFEEAVRALA